MRTLSIILLLTFVITLPVYADDLLHGRAIYMGKCSSCHGEFGKGDGPRAATLDPKPTNLTDPKVMSSVTPERIERAIVQGVPNVKEHTFGHLLTHEEVRDVITYVRSLNR